MFNLTLTDSYDALKKNEMLSAGGTETFNLENGKHIIPWETPFRVIYSVFGLAAIGWPIIDSLGLTGQKFTPIGHNERNIDYELSQQQLLVLRMHVESWPQFTCQWRLT